MSNSTTNVELSKSDHSSFEVAQFAKHVSLNLETINKSPTSVITTIDVIAFNEHNNEMRKFHCHIDSSLATEEALEAIEEALKNFSKWWRDACDKNSIIYGNDIDFDLTVLNHSFDVVSIKAPCWNKGCISVQGIACKNPC